MSKENRNNNNKNNNLFLILFFAVVIITAFFLIDDDEDDKKAEKITEQETITETIQDKKTENNDSTTNQNNQKEESAPITVSKWENPKWFFINIVFPLIVFFLLVVFLVIVIKHFVKKNSSKNKITQLNPIQDPTTVKNIHDKNKENNIKNEEEERQRAKIISVEITYDPPLIYPGYNDNTKFLACYWLTKNPQNNNIEYLHYNSNTKIIDNYLLSFAFDDTYVNGVDYSDLLNNNDVIDIYRNLLARLLIIFRIFDNESKNIIFRKYENGQLILGNEANNTLLFQPDSFYYSPNDCKQELFETMNDNTIDTNKHINELENQLKQGKPVGIIIYARNILKEYYDWYQQQNNSNPKIPLFNNVPFKNMIILVGISKLLAYEFGAFQAFVQQDQNSNYTNEDKKKLGELNEILAGFKDVFDNIENNYNDIQNQFQIPK